MQSYMPNMSIQFYTRRISFFKRMASEIFQTKLQINFISIMLDTKNYRKLYFSLFKDHFKITM